MNITKVVATLEDGSEVVIFPIVPVTPVPEVPVEKILEVKTDGTETTFVPEVAVA